jgi:hypothetical protein
LLAQARPFRAGLASALYDTMISAAMSSWLLVAPQGLGCQRVEPSCAVRHGYEARTTLVLRKAPRGEPSRGTCSPGASGATVGDAEHERNPDRSGPGGSQCSFCQQNAFWGALIRVYGGDELFDPETRAAVAAIMEGKPHPIIDKLRQECDQIDGQADG